MVLLFSEALSLGKICIVNNFYSGFYEQVNYRNDIVYFINYYYDNLKDVIENIFNLDRKEFEYRVQGEEMLFVIYDYILKN